MAQHVDAIVTDIPYEMKVQFLSNGDEIAGESASCKQAKVDDSTRLLLSIAAKLLKSRGRLVFFYPVRLIRGSHSDSLQQMLQPLNQNLTLIHKIPQDMSTTFRRYLVVVERA
jgi:tRNA G10  N-methylase Trm11